MIQRETRARGAAPTVSGASSSGMEVRPAVATRSSSALTRPHTRSSSARPAVRCSARTSSARPNRPTSNSVRSSRPRSSGSARRNRAKSPCGSRTTWQNCSAESPRRSRRCWEPSSIRVLTVCHTPSSRRATGSRACSVVQPSPRRLGRRCSGRRIDPQPLAAEGQLAGDLGAHVRGGVVAAEPLLLAAGAGHRAVEGEDDRVEQRGLARAGGPQMRKSPSRPMSSRSTSTEPAKGPNAQTDSECTLTGPPRPARPRRARRASRSSSDGGGLQPADRPDELRGDLQVAAAPQPLAVAGRDLVGGRRGPLQVHAVGEPLLQPAHGVDRPGRVGEPHRQEVAPRPRPAPGRRAAPRGCR